MAKLITEFTDTEMFNEMKRRGLVEDESESEDESECEDEIIIQRFKDEHKEDYTKDVEEEPIQRAYIDYETYEKWFSMYYQEEKEHDKDTYFHLEVMKKKNWKEKEMSVWSEMYFKIEPDHEKTNKTFERVKYNEYNTSSYFAMMLCGLDFDDEEEEEEVEVYGCMNCAGDPQTKTESGLCIKCEELNRCGQNEIGELCDVNDITYEGCEELICDDKTKTFNSIPFCIKCFEKHEEEFKKLDKKLFKEFKKQVEGE